MGFEIGLHAVLLLHMAPSSPSSKRPPLSSKRPRPDRAAHLYPPAPGGHPPVR